MRLNPVTVNARDAVVLRCWCTLHQRDDHRRDDADSRRSARARETSDERLARRREDAERRRTARRERQDASRLDWSPLEGCALSMPG